MSAVLLATLVMQVIDFLRELTNLKTQKSAVLTQLSAWGAGIALAALSAHASVTANLTLPGLSAPMHTLDAGSVVLVGMLFSSLASTIVDVKQAIDSGDSSAKPSLIPSDGA